VNVATGELIVFTDANAMFDDAAVASLAQAFACERVGCVIGQERRASTKSSGTAKSDGLYWKFENMIKRVQNQMGLVLVGNGPIFAIRRELFRPVENDVANDFQTPVQIGNDGWLVVFREDAISFENSASSARDEYARKIRIITRGLVGFERHASKMRGLRLFMFISHKVMRWFAFYVQILLGILTIMLSQHHWMEILLL